MNRNSKNSYRLKKKIRKSRKKRKNINTTSFKYKLHHKNNKIYLIKNYLSFLSQVINNNKYNQNILRLFSKLIKMAGSVNFILLYYNK